LPPEIWQKVFIRNPDVNATIPENEAVLLNLDNGYYYTLDRVGTAIWQQMTGEHSLDAIVSLLCARYEVMEQVARQDLADLVSDLLREGLLVERGSA
jgi:hypothetical protein